MLRRVSFFAFAALLATIGSLQTSPTQAQQRSVPIVIGGDDLDACVGWGVVVGLDPNGDGFLSVRSGPGGREFFEKDRVHNGQGLVLCTQSGPWIGVVYTNSRGVECNTGSPWPVRQAYTGPCRWGWVHSRYVRHING